jgi:glycerophosphoryl diester phosphodiesterase
VLQVIAHRGASRHVRENTIDAFVRAAAMGSDGAELDVRRTLDGALVVHHDACLADGRVIAALPRALLPGHVPTLDEALDACRGMWVNVEIKNDPGEPDFDPTERIADETVALLLQRSEPPTQWLISCFRLETIDRCRALAPQIRTAWLVVDVPAGAAATCVDHGHSALHPWVHLLEEGHVLACHDAGLAVNTWTCDDPMVIARLIDWGVDGVCTNDPAMALEVRRRR